MGLDGWKVEIVYGPYKPKYIAEYHVDVDGISVEVFDKVTEEYAIRIKVSGDDVELELRSDDMKLDYRTSLYDCRIYSASSLDREVKSIGKKLPEFFDISKTYIGVEVEPIDIEDYCEREIYLEYPVLRVVKSKRELKKIKGKDIEVLGRSKNRILVYYLAEDVIYAPIPKTADYKLYINGKIKRGKKKKFFEFIKSILSSYDFEYKDDLKNILELMSWSLGIVKKPLVKVVAENERDKRYAVIDVMLLTQKPKCISTLRFWVRKTSNKRMKSLKSVQYTKVMLITKDCGNKLTKEMISAFDKGVREVFGKDAKRFGMLAYKIEGKHPLSAIPKLAKAVLGVPEARVKRELKKIEF